MQNDPSSELTQNDPPGEAAVAKRAYSLCNEAVFTIALQCRRTRSVEPEDDTFVMRWWADLQFLIVALRRLRRCAQILSKYAPVQNAIRHFDLALPGLDIMRNVGEHIDSYAIDSPKRHQGEITRRALQTGCWDGSVFKWLGHELDIDVALEESEKLFEAVKMAAGSVMRADQKIPSKLVGGEAL